VGDNGKRLSRVLLVYANAALSQHYNSQEKRYFLSQVTSE
jgi:hypothetical protein